MGQPHGDRGKNLTHWPDLVQCGAVLLVDHVEICGYSSAGIHLPDIYLNKRVELDSSNEAGTRSLRELIMGNDVKYFLEVPLPYGNVHIDGLFMVLDEKLCVIYEPMFDVFPCRLYEDGSSGFRNVMFRELLDERGFDCIATNHQERKMGLLNIVVTKRSERAIGFAGAARIGEEMAKYGIGLESFSADEMWQGNGGAHCMTCPFLLG